MSETMRDFNRIILESNELYHDAARAFGLSDSLFWILYSLRDCGGALTQTELVRRMCMPKQTVNSALKKLEAAGYLTLTAGADQRSKHVQLTEAGERFARAHIDCVPEAEARALCALSQADLASFFSIMRQFRALFERELREGEEAADAAERHTV